MNFKNKNDYWNFYPKLPVGSFFHHLHHRYFNCNYGSPEIPFDKWFKTYNDGTEEATNKFLRN